MNITQRFIKMWVLIGGYCIALILVGVLPFVLWTDDNRTTITVNSLLSMLGVAVVTLVFGVLLYRNLSPAVLRQAHAHGIAASATVSEVSATGWRVGKSRPGKGRGRGWRVQQGGIVPHRTYHKYEYKLRVQVQPPAMPPYEAVIFHALPENQVPQPGDALAVKIHPQRAEVVVLAENSASPA
ncbi:MAG: hypothetical protein H7Y11_07980 [Armatimonadetes bacterium]|nr:hypothetical protein [Anaerolineae bacterium]